MTLVTKCNVKLGKDKIIPRGTKIDKKSEHFNELSKLKVLVEESGEISGKLAEQVATLKAEVEKLKIELEKSEKEKADLLTDCETLTAEVEKLKKSK